MCEGLQGNKILFQLNVSNNQLTSTGVHKLASTLATTHLKELDLSLNPLGN